MKPVKAAVCVLLALVFVASTIALAQGPPMPKAGPEQQRLKYFAGTWKNEGEMKTSDFGPPGKYTSTDESHMLGDFYLVTHSKGNGPMGAMDEIATLGYDPKLKAYTYSSYNSLGMHDQATGQVSGKTWTWTNEEDMGGKKVKGKFTITEVSPTSYTYTFDASTDGSKWTNVMTGKATKTK
jgi:hypothetical protein